MGYRIVKLDRRHVEEIVAVHLRAFPAFFLTFLGPRFLREFYRSFVEESSAIAWIAEDEGSGRVLGGVVGTDAPSGYFRRLLVRRWWAFGLASVGAVFRKPSTARRMFRAVSYRGDAPAGPSRALLSSIAVAPEAQGSGLGRALVCRWVEEVRIRSCPGCYLTTDAEGNDVVNRFYQRLGWKVNHSFTTPEGRRMNQYVIDFEPAHSGERAEQRLGES